MVVRIFFVEKLEHLQLFLNILRSKSVIWMEKKSMKIENSIQRSSAKQADNDQRVQPTQRIRLPHSVIVRAPGLLPMLYTLSELEAELGIPARTLHDWLDKGMPHQRDPRGRIWIDGSQLAVWVQTVRTTRSKRSKLNPDEAYCFHCHKPAKLVASVVQPQGKQALLQGTCPECGTTIHRGIRHG